MIDMKRVIRANIYTLAFVISLLVGGLSMGTAHAANGGLTLSPTSVDQEIAPGGTYNGEVTVINQGDLDLTYDTYVTPYSVDGEDYKPYFTPIKGAKDVTKWFKLGGKGGPLKVGQSDTVPYTVTVPKDAGAGSYYATVFAETTDKDTSGTGVVTRKRLGAVVYIRVTGDAVQAGNVESWGVPWLQSDPLHSSLRLANTGSVYYQADMKITVKDLFGGTKLVYERQPRVIPQKVRNVPMIWQDGAKFGFFKVQGTVTIWGKTTKLPARYVFVANTFMRLVTALMLIAFVAIIVFMGKKRVAKQ